MSDNEVSDSKWLLCQIASSYRQARLELEFDAWEGAVATPEDWDRAERLIELLAGQGYITRKGLP